MTLFQHQIGCAAGDYPGAADFAAFPDHAMQTSHSLLLFACSRLSVVEKVMLPRETDVIEIPRFFLLHTAMGEL